MLEDVTTGSPQELIDELKQKDLLLAEKDAEIERLRHRIRLLEKALFGPRSEKVFDDPANQQTFDELLAQVGELNRELERKEQEAAQERKRRTPRRPTSRRKLSELIPEDLPREEIVLDVPEEQKVCPDTGQPLRKIGEERSAKLAYKPGYYYLRVLVRPKYVSPGVPSQGVVCEPMPDSAFPGSQFDESFAANVIVEKCGYHMPLYRQEEKLRHAGIHISRQTLCRLYLQSAEVLRPLYERIKKLVLARGILFTDDTPVDLQVPGHRKTVTGRMWVYVAGGIGPPYRIYEFTRDRTKSRPKEFLNGFQGYIHADAYQGYDDLFAQEGIFECGCWMHVRRKFTEAMDAPAPLRRSVLAAIRLMYRYERNLRDAAPEKLLAMRQQKIAPLIELVFDRTAASLKTGEVLPKSAFAEAIGYMHNLGPALKRFLDNPLLEPDNGASERALRPLTIGRRNWLFAGSQRGGEATGILLTMTQNCRVFGIDPFVYLTDVLRRIQGHPMSRIEELLPHNWRPAHEPGDGARPAG